MPPASPRRSHPLVDAVRPLVDAVGGQIVPSDAAESADVPLVWEGDVIGAVRLAPLHGALDRLIASVEAELGQSLPLLPRAQKQRAIRLLEERGAFVLRRSVEDVADAMGVSRITVYNYLNAVHK
ncbi:helix-turn-helix domain-containing protein [Ilumatobacter coccineus]|uniref:Transcriptional regulator DauR-like HTH domain-containing protein n=1 Tax=Ilumatobacter coccineus (strain NBRC 103263 / KCTC 29153 / YM16-304) TaxID=1313172 RepID=A0A6C7E9B7_ILUCY|nr:helix-turn-helix domain-containing protein [Ilumatobacter coccineus]BAN00646.1 hypothetical protein YM304_03320 [Ilumatobacter coccineus YM16-304]